MFKHVLRLLSLSLFVVLILSFCTCLAKADTDLSQMSVEEIKALIPKIHSQALTEAQRTTFSGYCGKYTHYQLTLLGINYVPMAKEGYNGKKWYDSLTNNAVTSTGYTQVKYKGKSCLKDIVAANNGEAVYNIVVSQSGGNSPTYGHVYFIYAIIPNGSNYDNYDVYWSENSTWGGVKEGQVRQTKLKYMPEPQDGEADYVTIGAIHFVKNDYKTIDTTDRIAVSTKTKTGNTTDDQCYIKTTPFEAGDTVDVIDKGAVINITGAVENKYGNIWYRTEDDNFVYSGDVTIYDVDWTQLFTLSANFTFNNASSSRLLPYDDSPKGSSFQKGQMVTVKKLVTNKYGNIWAQLSDGSFVCFHDMDKDETYMTFHSHVTQPTHSTTYPTGNITVSSSQGFWLKGPVKAEVPFFYLSTRIVNRETGEDVTEAGSPVKIYPSASTRTFDIYETKVGGKSLDSQTLFKKLTAGWYRYELNVQFGFTHEGKTFKFGSEMNLVKSDFTVNNPTGEEPAATPTPTPTPAPTPTPTPTVLVENIAVTNAVAFLNYGDPYEFQWEVYPSNAANKDVTWTSSNENVLTLSAAANGGMEVRYVGCGTTLVTVAANDDSGASTSFYVYVSPVLCYDWLWEPESIVGKTTYCALSIVTNPDFTDVDIKSSDESILEVSYTETSPGQYEIKMLGINPGTAFIDVWVYNGEIQSSFGKEVAVRQPVYVESINIYGLSSEMKVGETAGLYFTFNPTNNDCDGWRIASSDPSVIELRHEDSYYDEHNNFITPVVAHALGTVTITVEADDGSGVSATYTITVKASRTPGDANEDGTVTFSDALVVLQHCAGENVIINTSNADVNADGKVDIHDALLLLQYGAGWNVTLK